MTVNKEDEYLMLSGIQHFKFCRRQWALIHIEQLWLDNVRTLEGDHLHRLADDPFRREKRGDKLIVRALPVHSHCLRISGICDVVEFVADPRGLTLAGEKGTYLPYPVEYKRGKPKQDDSDRFQLVAQAMCLEEMLMCEIRTGYFYYQEIKHRVEVQIEDRDRAEVQACFEEMHGYFNRRHTPKASVGPHCRSCSLEPVCVPQLSSKRSVANFIKGRLDE